MRSGLIAQKLGMTRIYNDAGEHVPVTVLRVENCQVVAHRTADKDGYTALQLGCGRAKVKNTPKAMRGHFAVAQVEPKRTMAEFRVSPENVIAVGAEMTVDHFLPGQFVDVTGTSIGKGFAGVMKRHGFAGVSASHGSHRNHRKPGSIGGASTPSRVYKGLRMAGRMGHDRQTTQNLTVHAVDAQKGLLLVKGAVPGPKGGVVLVRSAVKGA